MADDTFSAQELQDHGRSKKSLVVRFFLLEIKCNLFFSSGIKWWWFFHGVLFD
jgi:hypothetical protein